MVRVLAFIADPPYQGKRLHERWGWTDPFAGVAQAVEDLNVALGLGGNDAYTLKIIEIPLPAFGTRNPDRSRTHIDDINVGDPITLSPAEWVQKWESTGWNPGAWPGAGELHIRHFLQQHVLPRILSCDEVWLAGMPMPMAFEGAMLAPTWDLAAPRLGAPDMGAGGPGGPTLGVPVPCTLSLPKDIADDERTLDRLKAYRTHDTLVNAPELDKRYVLHMFQVSNFNPIHNFTHRCESVLSYIYNNTGWNGYQEQWGEPLSPINLRSVLELFGNIDSTFQGLGAVGSGHFHVPTKIGYEYRMHDSVPSIAHLFKDFPNGFPINLNDLPRLTKLVSAKDWAHFRDAQQWWLSCLPRNPGMTDGRWNDWRKYVIDVNDETGRNEPLTRPVVGSVPRLPVAVTRVEDRALLRWEPYPDEPGDVNYLLSVDGKPAGNLRRWNQHHVRLSMDVPLGRDYRIKADIPGGQERIFNKGVPTPDDGPPPPTPEPPLPDPPPPIPTPEPGETMLSLEQVRTEVLALHQTVLAGCQPPDKYEEEANNIRLKWNAVVGESIGILRISTVEDVRENYPVRYRNHAKLSLLCGSSPEPPPAPPGALTLEQVEERVLTLYAPGARYTGCTPPDNWSEDASAYRAYWDLEGNNLAISKPVVSVEDAQAKYIQGYSIMPGRDALCAEEPPPPDDPPTPTPALSLRPLFEAEALAHEAAARTWRERMERLP